MIGKQTPLPRYEVAVVYQDPQISKWCLLMEVEVGIASTGSYRAGGVYLEEGGEGFYWMEWSKGRGSQRGWGYLMWRSKGPCSGVDIPT